MKIDVARTGSTRPRHSAMYRAFDTHDDRVLNAVWGIT